MAFCFSPLSVFLLAGSFWIARKIKAPKAVVRSVPAAERPLVRSNCRFFFSFTLRAR